MVFSFSISFYTDFFYRKLKTLTLRKVEVKGKEKKVMMMTQKMLLGLEKDWIKVVAIVIEAVKVVATTIRRIGIGEIEFCTLLYFIIYFY